MTDWFREALANRKIAACIPSKSNRKAPIPHDAVLYKQRHRIENMFGRLKDWRPHPLRPLRPHLFLGNLHRRSRHLLALINES
jgi:transposase